MTEISSTNEQVIEAAQTWRRGIKKHAAKLSQKDYSQFVKPHLQRIDELIELGSTGRKINPKEIEDLVAVVTCMCDHEKAVTLKLIVVPFFKLLKKNNIVPSPEKPLSDMVRTMFDFAGVEPKYRPTDLEMATIRRKMKISTGVGSP